MLRERAILSSPHLHYQIGLTQATDFLPFEGSFFALRAKKEPT
jgi:hypothetical protein